jgi:hypothetical protein
MLFTYRGQLFSQTERHKTPTCTHFHFKETVSVLHVACGKTSIFLQFEVTDDGGPILERLRAHHSLCLQIAVLFVVFH